ncbi:MAG TPA: HDOD domain-containing protein, partial [Dissulfurispiraceae bacterium]|nr:HDOD domain-containing protein [Dissulfurispiraceae bacterium]
KETRILMPDEALVAGLIHDLGIIIINNSVPDEYQKVIDKVAGEKLSFVVAEDQILGFNHCTIGGLIARKWKLPANLVAVIEYHHSEQLPELEEDADGALHQIVQAADTICLYLGIGMSGQVDLSKIDCEQLGLTAAQFDTLLENVKLQYSEQKGRYLH